MATEPQSTSQAPVTSLRETSVWSIDTYPKIWEGGREGGRVKKQASEKATQAKAHDNNAPANLPGTPPPPSIPGNTAALAWF